MRNIQSKISLEPMKSRLPGVLPAYQDNILYFFDKESLIEREWEFQSNYSMIPVNIVLEKAPSAVTSYDEIKLASSNLTHCYGNTIETNQICYPGPHYDEFTLFTLSWENLSKWYKFFTDYYYLLNDWGHCGTSYSSATHYYAVESKNGYAGQMIYGSDKSYYDELDELFSQRGGKVKTDTFDTEICKVNHTTVRESTDEGFFKWICENIVPTFTIPLEYRDYWKRNVLYYPDVIKWIGWFKEKNGYEDLKEIWDCSGQTDCCECEEYFKRGGKDFKEALEKWFNDVQDNIDNLKTIIEPNISCYIPTVINPITLQTSIDDLGEFSIFSKEYELGIDYGTIRTSVDAEDGHTIIHYDEENNHNGTVAVSPEGDSIILMTCPGYAYDSTYMEFNEELSLNSWMNYIYRDDQVDCNFETYEIDYRANPVRPKHYFAFDSNNKKVTASTEDALKQSLSEVYDIEKRDAILIGDTLYDIKKEEFGIYDKDAKYIGERVFYVYRDEYTETPYVYLNGKRIYGKFYVSDSCDQFYYFEFFKDPEYNAENDTTCEQGTFNPKMYKHFPRTRTYLEDEDYKEFITYAGTDHEVSSVTGVTIDGIDYERIISGTCETKDRYLLITSGSSKPRIICKTDKVYEDVSDEYNVNQADFKLSAKTDVNVDTYLAGILTGYTRSKIYDLRSDSLLVDDVGNVIEGIYRLGNNKIYNHQPPEGEKIEPMYQVGNVSNISRFKSTVDKQENLVNNTNYFVGDIITAMRFYYRDVEGNEVTATSVNANSTSKTALKAIKESTQKKEQIEENQDDFTLFNDDINCDITYYVGATLMRTGDTSPFMITNSMYYNKGVCYTETVRFKEKEVQYMLREGKKTIPDLRHKPVAHTISYSITCYELEQDMVMIESDYNNFYECALARFEMPFNTTTNDFQLYNGTQTYPIYREEYRLGMACMQNVDSDIYIDRGINAAFEKHIKLGEVVSMEDLLQYSNGWYKIIDT